MKILKKSSFVLFTVLTILSSSVVYAWNNKVTHPDLTQVATTIKVNAEDEASLLKTYLCDNLGFEDNFRTKLPYNNKQMTIVNILKEGSKEEDDWPIVSIFSSVEGARFRHHFHNPLKETDQAGFDQPGLHGASALAWARGTAEGCNEEEDCEGNEYSWFEARYHYRVAFESESALQEVGGKSITLTFYHC